MEQEDETWAVGLFGAQEEPQDALLREWVDEIFRLETLLQPTGAVAAPPTNASEQAPPHAAGASPQAADESESASGSAVTVSATTKRKRIRLSRPFQEIQRLRQTVADLENLIALHNKRHAGGVPQICGAQSSATRDGTMPGVWQGVAARQFKFLREAQHENQQLRHQVQVQLGIAKNLIRLIQRASNGTPLHLVPRSLAEGDAGIVTRKRQHLFDVASEMYDAVNDIFATGPFANDTVREFRETVVCHHKGDIIAPGTLLASTCVSRFLPRSLNGLSELLWNVNQSDQAFHDAYKLEHREESSQSQSFVYSVTIHTPYGPVLCHGVGLRVRYCEAEREVVITTGSMWPDSSTPSPRNAVAYDFKEWVVVKPVTIAEDGSEQNQVLVRFETSRPSHPHGGEVRSHEQVRVLQLFIAQAHNFIVEQEQRQIDAILLGHARMDGAPAAQSVYV